MMRLLSMLALSCDMVDGPKAQDGGHELWAKFIFSRTLQRKTRKPCPKHTTAHCLPRNIGIGDEAWPANQFQSFFWKGWWKFLVWCQVHLPKFGESKNKIMTGHKPWFLPQLKRDPLNITLVHGQQFSGNETRERFQGSNEINIFCNFLWDRLRTRTWTR